MRVRVRTRGGLTHGVYTSYATCYVLFMPRTKRAYTDKSVTESKSAAKRQQGIKNVKPSPTITVPRVPIVFTDIPAVEKTLVDATGRYVYKIDEAALEALASTHASYEQLASVLGVPTHVLLEVEYKEIIEKARSMALVNLQSSQFKAAIEDRNPTMLIWLGKQHLGQKDVLQSQQLGADGKPINPGSTTIMALMPPNGRDLDPSRRLPSATAKVAEDAIMADETPQVREQRESA